VKFFEELDLQPLKYQTNTRENSTLLLLSSTYVIRDTLADLLQDISDEKSEASPVYWTVTFDILSVTLKALFASLTKPAPLVVKPSALSTPLSVQNVQQNQVLYLYNVSLPPFALPVLDRINLCLNSFLLSTFKTLSNIQYFIAPSRPLPQPLLSAVKSTPQPAKVFKAVPNRLNILLRHLCLSLQRIQTLPYKI
jgi:hypothetical protein